MASQRDLKDYLAANNVEDDQGNLYTPCAAFTIESEPPEDWEEIDLPGFNVYPSTIITDLPNNSIASINIPKGETVEDTITFTLKDGSYAEIDYEITGNEYGDLVYLEATAKYYNSEGVQDTSIGGTFNMNTASMKAGELEGWTGYQPGADHPTGVINVYFATNVAMGDWGGEYDFKNVTTGFMFINAAYEETGTTPYPIGGSKDDSTAAGTIQQFRIIPSSGTATGSDEISADRPLPTHYLNWIDGGLTPKEVPGEDSTAGTDGEPGGGITEDPDFRSDDILPDPLPDISVQNLGIFGVYKLSANRVAALSNFLWSQNFYDNVIKNFMSPMENIISFGILPFNPSVGADAEIHVGNMPTGVTGFKLSQLFYSKDCGAISMDSVSPLWNSFADYEPYSEIWVYLPYIGIVKVPTDDVAKNGSIKVQYKMDAFSGACVAEILTYSFGHWNVTGTYSGNCLIQFPLSNASYLQMYGSIVGSTVGMVASAAGYNVPGVIGSAAGMLTARPSYGRSGSVSNVSGMLAKQTPYLIKAIPNVIAGDTFRQQHGFISNMPTRIGSVSGFIKGTADKTKLQSISKATQSELEEIQSLIGSGIYV